jgi:hypothetical protein
MPKGQKDRVHRARRNGITDQNNKQQIKIKWHMVAVGNPITEHALRMFFSRRSPP